MDEDGDVFQDEDKDNIHCVKDDMEESYLTQSEYKESLINDQVS